MYNRILRNLYSYFDSNREYHWIFRMENSNELRDVDVLFVPLSYETPEGEKNFITQIREGAKVRKMGDDYLLIDSYYTKYCNNTQSIIIDPEYSKRNFSKVPCVPYAPKNFEEKQGYYLIFYKFSNKYGSILLEIIKNEITNRGKMTENYSETIINWRHNNKKVI